MNDATQHTPILAVRLIFEYEGDQVRLVSQQPVDVAVTGFDIARVQRAGHYVETRDAGGRTLARVAARDAFAGSVEVFPEKPGEPIRRVDQAKPRGAFSVVVPVPEGADHAVIIRVAPPRPDAKLPAARATTAPSGGPEVSDLAKFSLNISR